MNLFDMNNEQLIKNEDFKNVLKDCVNTWIYLESLGVDLEINKEQFSFVIVKYTVPEYLEISNREAIYKGYDISTPNGLIAFTKYEIMNMFSNIMKVICKINDDDDDIIDDLLNELKDSYKFYAKIRYGEGWTRKDQEKRIADLINEINISSEELKKWKEI